MRTLVTLFVAWAVVPAFAWQCQPLDHVAQRSSAVFLGTIETRHATVVEANPQQPPMAGLPSRERRVTVRVSEVLRGEVPPRLDLLCPDDDERCRVGTQPLLIALPADWKVGEPARLFCRFDEARRESALVEALRAVRNKR